MIAAELLAELRAGAVRGHDQVVAREVVEGDLRREAQLRADVAGAGLHQPQQGASHDGRHPVAAAADALTLEPDLDLVPVPAVLGQRLTQYRVGLVDPGQRPVGEHHAEPERVVGPVPLEDGHLDRRIRLPDEGGEEQPTRAASGDGDAHRSGSRSAGHEDVALLSEALDGGDQACPSFR